MLPSESNQEKLLIIFYTFVIFLNMKTAVSLPDNIYLEAEETTQNKES